MLKNYLTIALRFMVRQKGFSFINILGLTIGTACSLLIILYVTDELRFDTFHDDANQIYRVVFEGRMQGKTINSAYTGSPLAKALQYESKNVKEVLRIASWPTFPVQYQDRSFTEPHLLLADSNFFRFFTFRLIEGHPDSVLLHPRNVVITASAARRYFDYTGPGDTRPLGKTMVLAQGYTATVKGIAEDPPSNSHFHFTLLLSMVSWGEGHHGEWLNRRVITYFKNKAGIAAPDLKKDLHRFTNLYVNPALQKLQQVDIHQLKNQGNYLSFTLQPLTKIHLYSHLDDEIEHNGNIAYIYLFISIAAFITLLACINFMNLSTARSASRAKEVGVRKAVGAPTARLILQFLLESYVYILVAVLFAWFIIMLLIGPFNVLTGKALDSSSILQPVFLGGMALFIFLLGLLAGSYPAFYLTQFSPVEVLKGRVRRRLRSYGIRNVLVVFQFFISAGLIIATLTVYLQLRYIQNVPVGFDKRNLVNLLHAANLQENGRMFKDELLKQPGILAASYSNRLPPNIDWQYNFKPIRSDKNFILKVYEMDYDHLKTMRYSMLKGRFFSPDFPGDSATVILNETAARKMGFTSLHNQRVFTDYGNEKGMERDVIGIMQDFNYQSLKDSIQPMAIVLSRQPNWEMAIRIEDALQEETIERIKQLWKQFAHNAPFEYTFLERNFEDKLRTEKRIGWLFILFTVLAILIACLGLFGLATFSTELRTKEIGIRKVLGATEHSIVALLNRDFLKLVLIANVLAWPVTGWLMHCWLQQFAYHTTVQWWVFLAAGTITTIIAFFSVSSRALRAARGNPVNSLRNE